MTPEERWKKALEENPGKAIFAYMLYKYGKHNLTLFQKSEETSRRLRRILSAKHNERSTEATLRAYWNPSRFAAG